jgi:Asp-tRNA(Asn)/Glu-tRNA(Gln) amidotransferase A subunit family amidase
MTGTGRVERCRGIDAWRGAPEGELRGLVSRLVERAGSIDPRLHILARPIDRQAVARRIDELFAAYPDPAKRPPLFGVPVGVKDIIRVAGAPVGCGSLLPPVFFDGAEAECVRRLRAAGAIVLAQTATTEFAYFEPAATRNPHNPAHTPGGSSSGSAAGVAAGLFPLALGTQTAGSVIRPASFCGVVGMKPSFGKIPTDGVVYFSRSVDHVGFFCGSVADIAPVMAAFDPAFQADCGRERPRVGVPEGRFLDQVPPRTMRWFEGAVSRLEAAGIDVQRVACLEDIEDIAARHFDLMAAEFAVEQAGWFEEYRHLYRPRTAEMIERGRLVPGARVEESRRSCTSLRDRLTRLMDRHALDLWLCPSTLGEAPAGLGNTGSPAMNVPWTHAGLPAVSLPAGTGPAGLPLGLQCVGRFGGDDLLAGHAAILEKLVRSGSHASA